MTSFADLNEAQRRQLIDAESVYAALEAAEEEAWKHRGYMFWREQSGRNYLIRSWPNAKQNSLGPESPETRKTFEVFTGRKAEVEQRVKDLRAQVETMQRLNRALRVGRMPDIAVDILAALAKARVAHHFLLVGTNALYAYETAAGVRFPPDVLATRDADFLYDTRTRAQFLQTMQERRLTFLELLRKVDKSFERHPTENNTAVNNKGYEIDVLRRFPPAELVATEHPLQMTPQEDDLWAVRASTGQKLLSVPVFSQVVVGTTGRMARARTVHPLAFARIKRELSVAPQRDPLKAPRDAAQAKLVEELVAQFLPQWSTEAATPNGSDESADL